MKRILQIIPHPLGSHEGVGDYAGILAAGLARRGGYETEFVTGATLAGADWRLPEVEAIVLHYVNYGYHPRGVPTWLPRRLEEIRASTGTRLLTIFHELYATGPWRGSAFWLQPLQKKIARAIAKISAVCLVSSAPLAEQLQQLAPTARVVVRPVVSTFGEPSLSAAQMTGRDPRRWVICGGTALIERSLRSFAGAGALFILGGSERAEIRTRVGADRYWPNVDVADASALLATCAFGWMDYFQTPNLPTAAILKSTTFAAYCAHGVVPVFPAGASTIALGGDVLPGPFTPDNLPSPVERPAIAQAVYDWYWRNASSDHLAESLAEVIGS